MRNYFVLTFSLLTALILSGCFHPPLPNPPINGETGTLTGTVQDSVSGLPPLWQGTATLAGQSAPIANGSFQFTNVPVGTQTLTITTRFHKPWQKQVVIGGSETALSAGLVPIFSAAELDLFARLVHAEAKGGESYEGQVAVAATVLNRLLHPDYPQHPNGSNQSCCR